ncbi:MAG: extracellular solute-binding protein [Chloroflexi bacterium]|nr:extracellular solute-binding protein [Chloroflexota bacterium]
MNGKIITRVTVIGLVCLSLVLSACAGQQAPAPAPTTRAPAQGAVQPGGWQADWEKTLAAARHEGELMIYASSAAATRNAMGKAFKDKYGINIEWVEAPSAQLTAKILQERRAGLYIPDLTQGSTTNQVVVLKPQGHTVPIKPLLILPEVLDKSLWSGGDIAWVDNDKTHIMSSLAGPDYRVTYNKNMVKPDEIQSYNDLLNPRWKGKIVIMNPVMSGRPFTEITLAMGVDWWRKFVQSEPAILDNDRLAAEWVAQGKTPLGIIARSDVQEEIIAAGAPIARATPKEGAFVSGGGIATSLLDRAPHPNAAKIYVNWYLSKEGSEVQSKVTGVQSARTDVPTDHLSSFQIRQPGVKYIPTETEAFFEQNAKTRDLAMEIFGPLMGRK